ncbi:MAG: J domain-containing protein [Terriglobales bacterium]
MAELPDYYSDLGVKPEASPQEIEKTYIRRVNELRVSEVEDSPEELAEVEAAYAFLRDPAKRAEYDAKLRQEDEEWDKKNPEMATYLKNQSHRSKRVRRSGSWLSAIWDLLDLFK